MGATVLLITPPFTQLNTPYPATAYLKGFLNTRKISSFQCDLGIETTLAIFSRKGLSELFSRIEHSMPAEISANAKRILHLKAEYLRIIDSVIHFLQGHNPTLAHLICKRDFLPEASRFDQIDDLDWAFGNMGIQDKAKHLATMFLEDLADLIKECLDPHFGFSRYAEKLARSASSFDSLYDQLQKPLTLVDETMIRLLERHMKATQPKLIAISVPFPGNLLAALRCGQWVKRHYSQTKLVMGGGFANTELRSVSDPRVFEFFDYITLDDGEAPLERLVALVNENASEDHLKRTFVLHEGKIEFRDDPAVHDYRQSELGTPDYTDLLTDQYVSAIEVVNPMHRMWSDGRWNKLTMAHGCYWGKCTFCDISLDYIRLYEPIAASIICDRMSEIMKQTGQNGFHFVDEAAPPALMRAVALEILRRGMTVSWWTNIRFEKSFTRDLCLLLKASGCIAVSGGLEVASDRLLGLIQKGITVGQVARVNKHFTEAGIMVHAYLMYGFPTQTAQETIDSLEMVRQMFSTGILQSAYWHQFTMTAHSPVGLDPARFQVSKAVEAMGSFANNDIEHIDQTGTDHPAFAHGLAKSLLNYMHGMHLDKPLQYWFDFPVPRTSIFPDFIGKSLTEDDVPQAKQNAKLVWLGKLTGKEYFVQSKRGQTREMVGLSFITKNNSYQVKLGKAQGEWLASTLDKLSVTNQRLITLQKLKEDYEAAGFDNFELFWDNKPVTNLYKCGLLVL